MIRRTASAVFLLRDGFTGTAFTGGAGAFVELDGRPVSRPVWKREGYLVLTDIPAGKHSLVIRRRGYREERVDLDLNGVTLLEDTISLKPGAGYRFPEETVRVTLRLTRGGKPAGDGHIWLGCPLRTKLKLAQEKAEAGEATAHLFCEGNAALLPVPGHFLMLDKKAPELTYLRFLQGETAEFSPVLTRTHPRGTELIPMQSYGADEAGTVQVLLREPGALMGFDAGKVYEAQLHAGSQELEWELEG